MARIIDGLALASKHQGNIKIDILNPPHLVSFFDLNNKDCLFFTSRKQDKAWELGIAFDKIGITPDTDIKVIETLVEGFNSDPNTNGIMFQLPLPEHLQNYQDYLINLIRVEKDIDGLTGHGPYLQATVKGVLSILKSENVDLKYVKIAVVGSEGMVGKGFVQVLKDQDAQVIEVDKKLKGSSLDDLKDADVVISCTGVSNLIKSEHIKRGSVLIDVGLGDFDPSCYEKADAYTPVKGGVGPMTVISLMENVTEAATARGPAGSVS